MSKRSLPKLLWVDDDSDLFESARMIHGKSADLSYASSVDEAKTKLMRSDFDAAVIDLNFEGHDQDGLDLLNWIDHETRGLRTIVLSGDTNTRRVSRAAMRPNSLFVVKGPDADEQIHQVVDQLTFEKLVDDDCYFQSASPLIRTLMHEVDRICASKTKSSVLILGETGSGKEELVREIARKLQKKLVSVNIATISKERAESELFGHKKGAFTGAIKDEPGLIRQAHGNIFFMDEIGECSPEVQAKLLRVLQEREVTPVGGVTPSKVDLQFLAATHQPIEDLVRTGRFRLDLLQRLNTFVLRIPPLRERPEDIRQLFLQFIQELSPPDVQYQVTSEAFALLLQQDWLGNVRELKSVAERCVVLANSREIGVELIRETLGRSQATIQEMKNTESGDSSERRRIVSVLESVGWNREMAARKLNVTERHVYRMLRKFNIQNGDSRGRSL